MIISEGNLKSSYVVMKLEKYMEELEKSGNKRAEITEIKKNDIIEPVEEGTTKEGLTNEELLDRINTDIATLRFRRAEEEAIENFESEAEDEDSVDYHYESVR